jgi:hypothetical protein
MSTGDVTPTPTTDLDNGTKQHWISRQLNTAVTGHDTNCTSTAFLDTSERKRLYHPGSSAGDRGVSPGRTRNPGERCACSLGDPGHTGAAS